jgi:DNA-binding XRE family transcriptional regulator
VPGILRFLGYDPRQEPQTLSQRLRHYRRTHGLFQKTLAARLGVDPGSIADWEKGKLPKARRLRRVLIRLFPAGSTRIPPIKDS